MLHPQSMAKIGILGPDTEMERTIGALHKMRVLHIVEHKKKADLDIGAPLAKASRLSDILVKTRSLCAALEIKEKIQPTKESFSLNVIEKEITNAEKEIAAAQQNLRDTEAEKKRKQELKEKLGFLQAVGLEPEMLGPFESLAVFAGQLADAAAFEVDLKKITSHYHLIHSNNPIALFVTIKKSADAQALLGQYHFSPIDLSALTDLKGSVSKNSALLEQSIRQLEQEKQDILASLESFRKKRAANWLKYVSYMEQELEKAEAPLKFGKTEEAFVIHGWVPEGKLEKTIGLLNKATSERLYIEKMPIDKHDKIPVELENPKAVRPFEFLMRMYTLPLYKELDPTFFLFMSFPLLFGFMLGDMGYGLTSLILFWLLKKKFPQARAFFDTLLFASLATIFFGALFGEFFGEEVLFGYELPHILSRTHQMMALLVLAIAVGVVHVNAGLIAGFFNAKKAHGFKKAFFEKLSWIVLQAGVALLALSLTKTLALHWSIGAAIIALAVVFLYLGEGINGLVELPGIFSNILSYARLMAIGLASVQLALVINEFAKEFFHAGGISIVWGVLLLVIGHVINLAVGLLGSFLHSLRLHYVEFFTKFFKGGGTPFQAFGVKTQGG